VATATFLFRATALALLLLAPRAAEAGPGPRRTIAVAAAANLRPVMEALGREFGEEHPGVQVVPTFGSSGALVAQIRNGAPYDLFLSADRAYPRALVEAGLGAEETVYALGALAVWLPRGSTVAIRERGLAALADPRVRRIAIANPAVAPYGRAARAALAAAGVLEEVESRLVLGQSVSQAAHFARLGAADAAILPVSLATAPGLAAAGTAIPLPPGSHPKVEQSAVVLFRAKDAALARAFLAFLLSGQGRTTLARHGYDPP